MAEKSMKFNLKDVINWSVDLFGGKDKIKTSRIKCGQGVFLWLLPTIESKGSRQRTLVFGTKGQVTSTKPIALPFVTFLSLTGERAIHLSSGYIYRMGDKAAPISLRIGPTAQLASLKQAQRRISCVTSDLLPKTFEGWTLFKSVAVEQSLSSGNICIKLTNPDAEGVTKDMFLSFHSDTLNGETEGYSWTDDIFKPDLGRLDFTLSHSPIATETMDWVTLYDFASYLSTSLSKVIAMKAKTVAPTDTLVPVPHGHLRYIVSSSKSAQDIIALLNPVDCKARITICEAAHSETYGDYVAINTRQVEAGKPIFTVEFGEYGSDKPFFDCEFLCDEATTLLINAAYTHRLTECPGDTRLFCTAVIEEAVSDPQLAGELMRAGRDLDEAYLHHSGSGWVFRIPSHPELGNVALSGDASSVHLADTAELGMVPREDALSWLISFIHNPTAYGKLPGNDPKIRAFITACNSLIVSPSTASSVINDAQVNTGPFAKDFHHQIAAAYVGVVSKDKFLGNDIVSENIDSAGNVVSQITPNGSLAVVYDRSVDDEPTELAASLRLNTIVKRTLIVVAVFVALYIALELLQRYASANKRRLAVRYLVKKGGIASAGVRTRHPYLGLPSVSPTRLLDAPLLSSVATSGPTSLISSAKEIIGEVVGEIAFRAAAMSLEVPTLSRHSVLSKGVLLDDRNVIHSTRELFKRITDWSFEEIRLYRPGDPRAFGVQATADVPIESIAELQAQDVVRIRFGDWVFFTASIIHDEPELLILEGFLMNVKLPEASTEVAWITIS